MLPRGTRLLPGALLLLLAPAAAEAQFGAIRRRVESQIGRSVLGQPAAQPDTPAFSDRVLEITDARIDQLVAGLRVEAAAAERTRREQSAADARDAAYERAQEAHARCTDKYTSQLMRQTTALLGLSIAAKAEQDRTGRTGGTMQDSLRATMARVQTLNAQMKTQCGDGPGPAPFEAMGADGDDDGEVRAARAAGLAPAQYAVLRERAAAWLLAQGGRAGRYTFAAGERAALERRATALAPFRAVLGG
jgi:hypothetical protein